MKRLAVFLLCLLFTFSALGQENTGADRFECDCGFDEEAGEKCRCFLQEGDFGPAVNGAIALLKEKGYLPFTHARGVFDSDVTEAVGLFQRDMDLPETGVLNIDTLEYLLWESVLPDAAFENGEEILMWVPTDGGEHLHIRRECSGMIAPRKITRKIAAALGIEPCEHCMQEFIVTEEAQYE